MNKHVFYIAGNSEALCHASRHLQSCGCLLATTPSSEVTHLLLPVPSFQADGNLIGGGDLSAVLGVLPENIAIIGGNLSPQILHNYHVFDLLRHEGYLAKNAAITAECALRIAAGKIPFSLKGCHILILGWGRIGKCLSKLLCAAGAEVTIAARKESDRAMAAALGYSVTSYSDLQSHLNRYRIIFNTVPFMVLTDIEVSNCRPDCVKIDLASVPDIGNSDVIWARGLPGKMMPESSGHLIAQTVLDHFMNKEDAV